MAGKTGLSVERKDVKRSDDLLQMDFLNIVSHELKTPLTPMTAYVDLLLKERLGSLTEQQRDALEIIGKNTKMLKRLIWDILDMSKLESGNMKFNIQQIDLTELVEEVIKDMGNFAKAKGIVIESKMRPFPLTEGDKERLGQVITNLLDNAIKFTPEIGMITVET
ncbi:MAG: HAMP domain-containing sensor histidine kinase, partial [Nanoarchaeota archaeon]|nr:HAMP domain-containing sensor histidine kinase [Nanoarchaeota archaeon]